MWRFWLGLPLDGYKLTMWCLKHLIHALKKALIGIWWLILPSGVSRFDFPGAHFVARTIVFYLLGSMFVAPRTVGWMMEMRPDGVEIAAVVLVMVMLMPLAAIFSIVNLAVAAELRTTAT